MAKGKKISGFLDFSNNSFVKNFKLDVNTEFPIDATPGDFALVDGRLFIMLELTGFKTWWPLSENYRFSFLDFSSPNTTWTLIHNMNIEAGARDYFLFDDSDNLIPFSDVDTVSDFDTNTIIITFLTPKQGRAVVLSSEDSISDVINLDEELLEPKTEKITLIQANIDDGNVPLIETPSDPSTVKMFIEGGTNQVVGDSYVVVGSTLSWQSLDLDGFLEVGDTLVISYSF